MNHESVEALEINTSMLLNLFFAKNIILTCFFFYFLIVALCVLIPAVMAQIVNPIAELPINIGIPSKEAKAEIEIHPETNCRR